MKIVLFLVIGFILGAGVLYLLQMKDLDRLDQADKELKKARQAVADAEIEHEQRLKERSPPYRKIINRKMIVVP
ncbi:MAG: hypothetical protein HC799_01500 [Limnothrix sp. RL_2_0]|nr:hypothetical protein [Limnothrix sp. RL_2_0]